MALTTRTRYALRALIDIARNDADGPVRAADIAERQQLSVGYLERILLQLVEAGLVNSRKGPGGGYLLARAADEVSLAEAIAAVGEELFSVPCVCEAGVEECSLEHDCPARRVWAGLNSVTREYLEQQTIADFAGRDRRAGTTVKNGLRPLRSAVDPE
ncbi:Rrf2 family transcriptional regulator [candidate division WOR-3 bacterium]|nr:Rrf2 family transcriptional regulator [candidate division WOR-3 bacterium]